MLKKRPADSRIYRRVTLILLTYLGIVATIVEASYSVIPHCGWHAREKMHFPLVENKALGFNRT